MLNGVQHIQWWNIYNLEFVGEQAEHFENSENCPKHGATFCQLWLHTGRYGMSHTQTHSIFFHFYQQPYTKFIVPLKYLVRFVCVCGAMLYRQRIVHNVSMY